MRASSLTLVALVTLSACVPKQVTWVHPTRSDEVQLQKDRYECLKEARYSSEEYSRDKNGARAGTQMKVDETLMDACMRARGYVPDEPEKSERNTGAAVKDWALRPPEADAVEIEGSVGLGNAFGTRRDFVVDATEFAPGNLLAPEVADNAWIHSSWIALNAGGGVIVPVASSLELRLRIQLRVAQRAEVPEVECVVPGGFYEDGCESNGRNDSSVLPTFVADAGWRPPGFPRLSLRAGLGAQIVPSSGGVSQTLSFTDSDSGDERLYDLEEAPMSARPVPFVRFGADFDVVHARPVGAGLGCFVDVLARSRKLSGEPTGYLSDSGFSVGGCMLQLRVRPQPLSE
mgnify:CR=1 FL=1